MFNDQSAFNLLYCCVPPPEWLRGYSDSLTGGGIWARASMPSEKFYSLKGDKLTLMGKRPKHIPKKLV